MKIHSLVSIGILPRGMKCRTRSKFYRGDKLIDEVWKFIVYPLKWIRYEKSKKIKYVSGPEVHFQAFQYSSNDIEKLRKQLHEHVDFICDNHVKINNNSK